MVILNLPKIENQYHFIKLLTQILSLCCFVFHGNKLALSIPMLCFFKGYISAESIPVLCLLWEQTSFISPNALFFIRVTIQQNQSLMLCLLWEQTSFISPSASFFIRVVSSFLNPCETNLRKHCLKKVT